MLTVSCTAVDEETAWKGKIMIVSMRPPQTTDWEYSSNIGVQIPCQLKQQGIPLYEAANPAAKRSLWYRMDFSWRTESYTVRGVVLG
jgi:hypothetical protein